jgi:hypothetical protein
MPEGTRYFDVIICKAPYHERHIVCDRCSTPFEDVYCEVFERGRRVNIYPFHTVSCCEAFIRGHFFYKKPFDYKLNVIKGGLEAYRQEESTEA